MSIKREDDYEIDLVRYWKVFKKWLWLIILIVGISLLITWVTISRKPTILELSMVIEPPMLGYIGGQLQYMEGAEPLKAKISEGTFSKEIAADMGIAENDVGDFKASSSKATSLVTVIREETESRVGRGEQIMRSLEKALVNYYSGLLEQYKISLDNDIARIQNAIKVKSNEIEANKEKIKILEEKENMLQRDLDEIKEVRKNTLLSTPPKEKEGQSEEIIRMLFTSIMQQNNQYASQLISQISSTRVEKTSAGAQNRNALAEIEALKMDLERQKKAKDYVRNIRVAQSPVKNAVETRKKQQLTLVGITSFICAFLFALFLDAVTKK